MHPNIIQFSSNVGPPIWTFFHTLAEKINPDRFHQVFPQLFNYIFRICRVLPCPDCSQHAVQFLQKVNPAGVRNKNDFRNIMFIFHNAVNRRKNKSTFKIDDVASTYANNNPVVAFNNFVRVFHTKGNMKLLAETFQRKLVLSDFRKWFMQNAGFFFAKPVSPAPQIQAEPEPELKPELKQEHLVKVEDISMTSQVTQAIIYAEPISSPFL